MAVAPASPETGSRQSAQRPAATETFGLALPPAALTVHSDLAGLREAIAALVHPLIEVGGASPPTAPRLTVVPRGRHSLPEPHELRTAPQLLPHPDGPRYVVLERSHLRTVVVRDGEDDSAPLVITARPGVQELTVEVPDTGQPAARAMVRLLGSLLGAQLTGRGAVFLHGSAVATDGEAVLILGPKHRGKSSLAFLAVTLCGADFVSDDTLVAWAEHDAATPVLRGWPKRVGISTALLADHPARDSFQHARLRRQQPGAGAPDTGWSTGPASRKRVFADLDEFTALTGATVATGARPAGVVLPRADRDRRGWRIDPVTNPADLVSGAILAGADLRNFSDYLGLLPSPRPEPDIRAAVLDTLRALPCVRVDYGPDANADFPRFWDEITATLGQHAGAGR